MAFPLLIVPDTNVLVSGVRKAGTYPAQIMNAWREDAVTLVTSPPILAELERVFTYPRVRTLTKLSLQEINVYLNELREGALLVPGTTPITVSPDPDDNKFFSCAVEAEADYIISGDTHHVLSIPEYQGVKTISPAEFVSTILAIQEAA